MRAASQRMTLIVVIFLVAGCQTPSADDGEDREAVEEKPDEIQPELVNNEEPGMTLVEPSEPSAKLMEAIENYEEWEHYAGADTHIESGHPGDVWVLAYANELGIETVEEELIPVPEGTIIVKEEYDADGAQDPFAVTVMEKQSDEMGDWYWLKTDPGLTQVVETPEGMVLEGTEDLGCIGCHGAASQQDYLMLPQF